MLQKYNYLLKSDSTAVNCIKAFCMHAGLHGNIFGQYDGALLSSKPTDWVDTNVKPVWKSKST